MTNTPLSLNLKVLIKKFKIFHEKSKNKIDDVNHIYL